jgi:hypothetical protein
MQNTNANPSLRQPQNSQPPQRGRIERVTRKRPCSICGKPDYCGISSDGAIAFCTRISAGSFHAAKNGAHLHRLIESAMPSSRTPRPQALPATTIESSPRADAEHVHKIYAILLRVYLRLSVEHKAALMARGLSEEAIDREGFRSTPTEAQARSIARELSQCHDLTGVAGFYRENGAPRLVWTDTGIIIPVRDQSNGISALMYRRTHARKEKDFGKYIWISSGEDRNGKPREAGASSGAPCHFANAHMMKDAEAVMLTEGALKAGIAAHLLNQPVIGNAPSCFGADFAANLKRDFPQLQTVYVAFDSDLSTNVHVRGSLFRLVEQLEIARFDVRVRMWPPHLGKGIDDYLLNISTRRVAA